MPKKTEREIATQELMEIARAQFLIASMQPPRPESSSSASVNYDDESSSSSDDENLLGSSDEDDEPHNLFGPAVTTLKTIPVLHSQRYLRAKSTIQKDSTQLNLVLRDYRANHPRLFRKYLRITPHTFDALVELLRDNEVFHNNSRNPQAPVEKQLAVALYRFGHFGNAAGIEEVGLWAGVSYGFVDQCTRRVLMAVTSEEVKAACVHWPSEDEIEAARSEVERMSCKGWRNGWCMVDGTLVPLYSRPHHFGTTWFDRKSNYSMNVQVRYFPLLSQCNSNSSQLITLPNLRIIDYSVGLPGSQHDSTAWKHTLLPNNHSTLLRAGEWIWGDSAYPIEDWLVAPYKAYVGLYC